MKFFLVAVLILVALAVSLGVRRIDRDPPSFPVRDPLPPGMTNPPLRRVGDSVPAEGARLWIYPDAQHSLTVIDTTDPEVYQVRMRDGTPSTINAAKRSHYFMEDR